jgi:hypothetical protein
MKYVEKAGRAFKVSCQDLVEVIKCNNGNSG